MATKQTSGVMGWYTVYLAHNSKAIDTLKELIKDEPQAILQPKLERKRVFVYTSLTWDFLRETLTDAMVCIAEDKNREQAKKKDTKCLR